MSGIIEKEESAVNHVENEGNDEEVEPLDEEAIKAMSNFKIDDSIFSKDNAQTKEKKGKGKKNKKGEDFFDYAKNKGIATTLQYENNEFRHEKKSYHQNNNPNYNQNNNTNYHNKGGKDFQNKVGGGVKDFTQNKNEHTYQHKKHFNNDQQTGTENPSQPTQEGNESNNTNSYSGNNNNKMYMNKKNYHNKNNNYNNNYNKDRDNNNPNNNNQQYRPKRNFNQNNNPNFNQQNLNHRMNFANKFDQSGGQPHPQNNFNPQYMNQYGQEYQMNPYSMYPTPQQMLYYQQMYNQNYGGGNNYNPKGMNYNQTNIAPQFQPGEINTQQVEDNSDKSILEALEYYFSEENLNKDFYIRSKMNDEGFISAFEILSFNKMKKKGVDLEKLEEILKNNNSSILEPRVTTEGYLFLRNKEWDNFSQNLVDVATLQQMRKMNKKHGSQQGNVLNYVNTQHNYYYQMYPNAYQNSVMPGMDMGMGNMFPQVMHNMNPNMIGAFQQFENEPENANQLNSNNTDEEGQFK